jgi:hypothetical protein
VLVHIGPHKTGTTAIQSVLASLRPMLREHGVSYPGTRTAHHTAAKALRQYRTGWSHDSEPAPGPAAWSRLAGRVAKSAGRVVVSSEFLAEADASGREQLVRDLGADRVHLLVGARNCAGIAVSNWQQVLRSGYPITLERWLDQQFRRDSVDQPRAFWRRADPSALVSTWLDVLPPERMTVMIVDERDRSLLPTTFERLLDLPPGLLADQRPPHSNRGLTAVEAALVRMVIEVLDSQLTWAEYSQMMTRGVIRRVLDLRAPGPDEPKSMLPDWAAEQAVREGDHSADALANSGVRIVGDVDWLRVAPRSRTSPLPITDVPLELAAEAVVGAIAVATRGRHTFDLATTPTIPGLDQDADVASGRTAAPDPAPVGAMPTRDLARLLASRVRAGTARRYRRLRRGRR